MNPDENEKIEMDISESCPNCSKAAYYRMSPDEEWRCYFCDPPTIVRRMEEHLSNKE